MARYRTGRSFSTVAYLAEPVNQVLPWGVWLLLAFVAFSLFSAGFWLLYYWLMAKIFGDKYAGKFETHPLGVVHLDSFERYNHLLLRSNAPKSTSSRSRHPSGGLLSSRPLLFVVSSVTVAHAVPICTQMAAMGWRAGEAIRANPPLSRAVGSTCYSGSARRPPPLESD